LFPNVPIEGALSLLKKWLKQHHRHGFGQLICGTHMWNSQNAKIYGYSEEFVDRIHNKHKKKEELRNLTTLISVLKSDDAPTKRHAITFYPAITNKLQKTFQNHQIDLYSNKSKLKDSLGNPKDKTGMLQKSGIYQVECEGCDSVYIGQTKRSLKTRFGPQQHSFEPSR
jgi:hypothetical protein